MSVGVNIYGGTRITAYALHAKDGSFGWVTLYFYESDPEQDPFRVTIYLNSVAAAEAYAAAINAVRERPSLIPLEAAE